MTIRITAADAARSEAVSEPVRPDDYQQSIAQGLSKAFDDKDTQEERVELQNVRVAILSDQHKGSRDGADDFRGCERAYAAALAYYLE